MNCTRWEKWVGRFATVAALLVLAIVAVLLGSGILALGGRSNSNSASIDGHLDHLAIPANESTWTKGDFLFTTEGGTPGTTTSWVLSAWFKPQASSAAGLDNLVKGKRAFAPPISFGANGPTDYAVCQNVSGADYDAAITWASWARAVYCVQLVRTRTVSVDAEHDYRKDCGWSTWPDEVLRCEPPPPPLQVAAPSCWPRCDKHGCLCLPFGQNVALQSEAHR